jgi:hypothetical protein
MIRAGAAFGLLLAFPPSAVQPPDPYQRQPGIDVEHYIFRLALTDASDEIVGNATVHVRFVADGIQAFELDLASVADGKGMTVSETAASGTALRLRTPATACASRWTSPPARASCARLRSPIGACPRPGCGSARTSTATAPSSD